MYLLVEFDTYSTELKTISDENWVELRSAIPSLPKEKPEWCIHGTHVLTHESLPVVAKHGLKFKLSNDPATTSVGTMLVKLQDQIDRLQLTREKDNMAALVARGAAVQIAIPDFALLSITEVTHLDDCCTDYLQSYLNDGWRILAVCPPNAQRRPDYILGRGKHD